MFDVIVIGGGPGGYVAAIRAAQLGLRAALVEKDALGGVCLNRGCIPTKSLLHAAALLRSAKEAGAFGLKITDSVLDYSKVTAQKERQVRRLGDGVRHLLEKNGVTLYAGAADIESPDCVCVAGERLRCRNIIIAVGSSPAAPKIEGIALPQVIDSDKALSLKVPPKSMLIVGGGVVGVEMAYIFRSFGCAVSVVELEERLVPQMDEMLSQSLESLLKKQGVKLYKRARVKAILADRALCEGNAVPAEISAEKILVASGRHSNGLTLALDRIGITHDRGQIRTDAYLRTNIPNIFAVGDVRGQFMLAHVASAEGIRAAENIAGQARAMDYSAIPQCIYTDPEAASVGLTERQAKEIGIDYQVSTVRAPSNGKSLIEDRLEGFVKILSERISGKVLGAHIFAPHASEMLTQCTAAVRYKASARELTELIYPHPTISEMILEAASGIGGLAIHA